MLEIFVRNTRGDENVAGAPSVGIFWGVAESKGLFLINEKTALNDSEVYGDFLTFQKGHCEVWEPLSAMSAGQLARRSLPAILSNTEYESFPRGRVVYHRPTSLFTIYADRRLQTEPVTSSIVKAFGLIHERFEVRSDGHYR